MKSNSDTLIALTRCALGDVAEVKVALQPQAARDDLQGRGEGGGTSEGDQGRLSPLQPQATRDDLQGIDRVFGQGGYRWDEGWGAGQALTCRILTRAASVGMPREISRSKRPARLQWSDVTAGMSAGYITVGLTND